MFHGKFPWKIHRFLPTLVASWHLVSPGSLSVASFAWGVLPRDVLPQFLRAKTKSHTFKALKAAANLWQVFSKKNAAADFGMSCFFLKSLISGTFFGSVFISKNQWDPMATSSWSFDPATSWGQLALEYIYIYIYIPLGIGSITLSHELPRLLNPTTPGIVTWFPQCHNIGNLMLGQVCGLLSDPISPELSFGQWQCIYFRVYLYVSNVNLEMFIQTCVWFSSTSFLVTEKSVLKKFQGPGLSSSTSSACMSPIKTDKPAENLGFQFLNGFHLRWSKKSHGSWSLISGPTFGMPKVG